MESPLANMMAQSHPFVKKSVHRNPPSSFARKMGAVISANSDRRSRSRRRSRPNPGGRERKREREPERERKGERGPQKERERGLEKVKEKETSRPDSRPSCTSPAPPALDRLMLSIAGLLNAEMDRVNLGTETRRERRRNRKLKTEKSAPEDRVSPADPLCGCNGPGCSLWHQSLLNQPPQNQRSHQPAQHGPQNHCSPAVPAQTQNDHSPNVVYGALRDDIMLPNGYVSGPSNHREPASGKQIAHICASVWHTRMLTKTKLMPVFPL